MSHTHTSLRMGASRRQFFIVAAMLAIVATGLYVLGIHGGFLLDDEGNILENGALHISQLSLESLLTAAYSFQPGNGSRPLAMLSFALDYWRSGLNAEAFKATNLVIHTLTVVALAFFFRRLLALGNWPDRYKVVGALSLALLWGIHPLQVSSVLYIVQRMQTLGTLFLVLALWAYLAMRQAQLAGTRSRHFGVLALLCWALAFASKEDSIVFPAFALALELTVLRFRAARPLVETALRRGYLLLVLAGIVAYLLYLPRQWQWDAYPGRDFSTPERLLTQGRVLVMYIGQILLPLPGRLPFFYDDYTVSRSLWQPVTTVFSLLLLACLLVWAWFWRKKRPLFSLGVMLFFAGHFIASNVLGLELVFEHRNHFPLIGALLAMGDLAVLAFERMGVRALPGRVALILLVASLAAMTGMRAFAWGDPMRLALQNVAGAPHSERAWLMLSGAYIDKSGGEPDSPWFDKAIEANQEGLKATGLASPPMYSNKVIYKTIRGDVSPADWDALLGSLEGAPMNPQNRKIAWILLNNIGMGVPLDHGNVVSALEIISARSTFATNECLRMAAWVHNSSGEPDRAFPFLERAVAAPEADEEAIGRMLADFRALGRTEWVEVLERQQQRRKQPK